MKVLVIGASGTIGKAITDRITADGHEVIAVSRKTTPGVDIGKSDDLKKFLEEMDPVDHIVCTGGAVPVGGKDMDTFTDDFMYEGINSKMMGQVNLIRFGHKKVNKGGSILVTGGIIAHKAIFPKNAHMGMICSALNGFVIGAADELKDRGVRINVIHPPLLQETAVAFGISGDGIPPAKEAAKCYAKCLFQESSTGQEYFLDGFGKDD